jgi:hypothetical protein
MRMIEFKSSEAVSLNIRTAFIDIFKKTINILFIALLFRTSYALFSITDYLALRVLFDPFRELAIILSFIKIINILKAFYWRQRYL